MHPNYYKSMLFRLTINTTHFEITSGYKHKRKKNNLRLNNLPISQ